MALTKSFGHGALVWGLKVLVILACVRILVGHVLSYDISIMFVRARTLVRMLGGWQATSP